MGGFFGITSRSDCLPDVFFGVDYHSHLGTRRAGMPRRLSMIQKFIWRQLKKLNRLSDWTKSKIHFLAVL